jgi:hypothetical protein
MERNNLRMAHGLPFVVSTSVIPMLKITRVTDTGTTTLIVSGRIQAEQLSDLRRSVEAERARGVVLDLSEVTLVDGEVVRFLLQCEMQGIRLARCPGYVREWMARDKCPP